MDVFNRVFWLVIALVLLGAGAAGLLAGTGVLGPDLQAASPLPAVVPAQLEQPAQTALLIIGVGGLCCVFLGVFLIKAALSIPQARTSVPSLRLARGADQPVTIVRGSALQQGLQRDLERVPGVTRARTSLADLSHQPRIAIRLDLTGRTDLRPIQDGVRAALQRLVTTTGIAPTAVEVTFRLHAETRRAL